MIPLKDSYQIVNRYRQRLPVDVASLAAELGIPVERVPMDNAISGKLTNHGDRMSISVNSRHSRTRQRFTIAHEIGHAILHNYLIGEGITDNAAYRANGVAGNPNIGPREETEANKFASSLLMPAEAIIELQNQELNREQMAQALDVSPSALDVRLSATQRRRE